VDVVVDGKKLFEVGIDFGDVLIDMLISNGVCEVKVCLVFICEFKVGICVLCYGCLLVSGKFVDIGEVVGIIVV